MTDWRDIVELIESFATVFHLRHTADSGDSRDPPRIPKALNPPIGRTGPVVVQQAEQDQLDASRRGYTGDLKTVAADVDLMEGSVASGSTHRTWDRLWRSFQN